VNLTLTETESLLDDHPCPCGGLVRISQTDKAPPGCAPVVIVHTIPFCEPFERLEGAAFVSYLLEHAQVPA